MLKIKLKNKKIIFLGIAYHKKKKKKPYQRIDLIDISIVLIIKKKIFKVLVITNIKKYCH